MVVRVIECKSALSKSGLADWCVNCYVGCAHGCRYCYARYMKRFTGHDEAQCSKLIFPGAVCQYG